MQDRQPQAAINKCYSNAVSGALDSRRAAKWRVPVNGKWGVLKGVPRLLFVIPIPKEFLDKWASDVRHLDLRVYDFFCTDMHTSISRGCQGYKAILGLVVIWSPPSFRSQGLIQHCI